MNQTFNNLSCPNRDCDSQDFEFIGNDLLKCRICGEEFYDAEETEPMTRQLIVSDMLTGKSRVEKMQAVHSIEWLSLAQAWAVTYETHKGLQRAIDKDLDRALDEAITKQAQNGSSS